ncbi:S1C family serine protease [Actinoplanes sp. NPDC051513]|uniref:S1C family serine protease n=1 Tax=Actinoplanes sp. NPDC051513 TaxID=3363908 RepID=UPI003795F0CE
MQSVGDRPVMAVLPAEGADKPDEKPKNPDLRRKLLIAAVAVWAVAITAVVIFRGGGNAAEPAAVRPSAAPSASDAPLTTGQVYQTLLPSLVSIRSTGKASSSSPAKSMAESATGTGVIANADGTILTANHVIEGAVAIQVTYTDGTTSAAEVKSADPKQDIATLTPAKLPETLVPATLGGGLDVGDDVVAMGNPLGLTASTTSGVVSGLDRVMAREEGGDITGLIQFDAAVNPGSSGGPLINDRGQVAGIVVALANPTDAGTFIGIGFAVPIGAALGGGQGDGRTPPL